MEEYNREIEVHIHLHPISTNSFLVTIYSGVVY